MRINKNNYYQQLLNTIVETIQIARAKAYKSLSYHQLSANFEIGKLIVKSQEKNGWGKSVVDNLSKDITKLTGGKKGYSSANLWHMRQFYLIYKDNDSLLELALQIPWGHNLLVLYKIKENSEREYYLKSTAQLGWTRAILAHQIKGNAYAHRNLNDQKHNFKKVLPEYFAEQVSEALKSGIILCPDQSDIEVEYALRTSHKPVGVANYRLTTELPDELKGKLPTVAQIKASLKDKL